MTVFQNKDTLKFGNRILNVVTLPCVAEMNATRRVGACDVWKIGPKSGSRVDKSARG